MAVWEKLRRHMTSVKYQMDEEQAMRNPRVVEAAFLLTDEVARASTCSYSL